MGALHLRHEPIKASKNRIKRLRGLTRPQYRLRVDQFRVFYDVTGKKSKSSRSSPKPKLTRGSGHMARPSREVALAKVKDDLSRYLRLAAENEIVITRHGRPAGILIGFDSEDDWFEYRLENHPEFLRRVSEARKALRDGRGVPIEDIPS